MRGQGRTHCPHSSGDGGTCPSHHMAGQWSAQDQPTVPQRHTSMAPISFLIVQLSLPVFRHQTLSYPPPWKKAVDGISLGISPRQNPRLEKAIRLTRCERQTRGLISAETIQRWRHNCLTSALTKSHDLQHQKPNPRVAKEVEQQVKRAWPASKGSLSTGIWEHWSSWSLRPELSQQIPREVPYHPTSTCQRLRALSLPGPHTLSCSSSSSQGDTVGQQVVRP